jgi:ATP adenylyltransferase
VDHVFAPWRRAWVTSAAATEAGGPMPCLFCRVWDETALHAENLVVQRGERCLVMLNRYPYTGGHLLVAPRAHAASVSSLDADTLSELMQLSARAVAVLERVYGPHGFNLGINQGRPAGAGIPDHVHLHVVPRWFGDTNFMTTVGGTRVVSESLDEAWRAIRDGFAALAPRPGDEPR